MSGDRNVRAIKAGKVTFVGNDPKGFGNYVVILQDDGYKVLYCHLESYRVKRNEEIKEGQWIGIEGSTGNSTGIHLHLEIRKAPYKTKDHINPAQYMGIENEKGVVKLVKVSKTEQKKFVQEKLGYDNNTMKYMFDFYRFGTEALEKLYEVLNK